MRFRRSAPSGPGQDRSRFAVILRRLRWPVVIVWILGFLALGSFAKHLSQVTDDSASAYLPPSAQSTRVVTLEQANQPGQKQQSNLAAVVFARSAGLTAKDLAAAAKARSDVQHLTSTVQGLTSPGKLQRSADGQLLYFTANISSPIHQVSSADKAAVKAIRQAADAASSQAGDGLQVAVTGQAAVNADGGSGSQSGLLLTTVVIVAVILLLVYRSPFLWVLPLASAFAGIVVAESGAHLLANAGLTVSSLSTAILTVLVFGAASDYALLLIHRYREELHHYAATEEAMAVALRRTLPTLLASAATVTGAMLCLLAADSASLHGLGPVGAVAVAAALLVQTTFLPALLLVTGRWVFWPRVPRYDQPGREESRLWTSIGARVARRPATTAFVSIVVLGAACVGLAALHIDNNPLHNLKHHPNSVTGADLLSEHIGPGIIAPLTILTSPKEADAAAAAIRDTPNITQVTRGGPVQGYASLTAIMSVDPYRSAGYNMIPELRRNLDSHAPGSLVGGPSAIQYDVTQAAHRDTVVLIPLVLLVILVVVALLLQAVIAPLVLVITSALSFAASFGLANLLWRHALGYEGIQAQLPLYIFIFLVALGVDYNIFLSARIREESREFGIQKGTLRGLALTGGVITAAGIVLAATFAALIQQPPVNNTEVGTAVALGVLIDTFLVRTVLVPASLLSIGERVWWPNRALRRQPAAGADAGKTELPQKARAKG
jgi:putative drug exporter of the RND superfamily